MAKTKTTLPAKIADMTAVQAKKTFTEQEEKFFRDLQAYIKAHNKENLTWYWELGVRMTNVRELAKKDKEHYGSKLLERLGAALGYSSHGPLYQAISVVEAFGTKKAFTEYTKLAGESGNVLTWGHIVMLSGISDTAIRLDLAATALEQCWTVQRLGDQVRGLVDRKARGIRTGNKKVKIPTSVKRCLQDVASKAEQFRDWVQSSWTGDAYDITARVEETPTSSLSEKLLDDFMTAQKQLADMIESAETMSDELSQGEATIRRKLAAQADADLAAADDEEEEEDEDVEEEADVDDDDASLADLAGDDDDDSVVFRSTAPVADDDDDEFVSVAAERNTRLREARALERTKERLRAARGK